MSASGRIFGSELADAETTFEQAHDVPHWAGLADLALSRGDVATAAFRQVEVCGWLGAPVRHGPRRWP